MHRIICQCEECKKDLVCKDQGKKYICTYGNVEVQGMQGKFREKEIQ